MENDQVTGDTQTRDNAPDLVFSDAEIVAKAREAWARVNGNTARLWNDWLLIGDALVIGREHALNVSGSNNPKGSRYNIAFGKWLRDNGFANIDDTTRTYLFKIMEIEDEIQEWRDGKDPNEQYRVNHPVNVWKKFHADKRREGQHHDKPPRRPGLREENTKLQEENDRLNQRVEDLQVEINEGGVAERDTIAEILNALDRRLENKDLEDLIDGLIIIAHKRGSKKTWGQKGGTRTFGG